jgi:hypothetical protein
VAEQVRLRPGAIRADTSDLVRGGRPTGPRIVDDHDATCHPRLNDHCWLDSTNSQPTSCSWASIRPSLRFRLGEYRQPPAPQHSDSCVIRIDRSTGPSRDLRSGTWSSYTDVDLDDRDFARLAAAFQQVPGAVLRDRSGWPRRDCPPAQHGRVRHRLVHRASPNAGGVTVGGANVVTPGRSDSIRSRT